MGKRRGFTFIMSMNDGRKVIGFFAVLVLLSGYTGIGTGGGFVDKDALGDAGRVLWNIGGEDRFNIYNSYPVEDIGKDNELGRIGRVTVDLGNEHATCPHGLGRWIQAQRRKAFVKEILFRFLEEIQCTRAALYFYGPGDKFLLATQYGFGRRDPLAIEHGLGDPMVARVRELRGMPMAYNTKADLGPLAEYLKSSGNAHLLLVPLMAGSEVIGFVDARDIFS